MLSTSRAILRFSNKAFKQNNTLRDTVLRPGTAMSLDSDHFIGPFNIENRRNFRKRLQKWRNATQPPTNPIFSKGNSITDAGDIFRTLPEYKPNTPKLGFEFIENMEGVNDTVRKLFSLDLADNHDRFSKWMHDFVSQIREHPVDVQSYEYMIAKLTVEIRNHAKHCLNIKKDKRSKTILHNRIAKRKKYLRLLKEMDEEKFNWILNELKIQYIPITPESFIKVSERDQQRRLILQEADNIKESKLKELREALAEEREKFEKEKEIELKDIEKRLNQLGISMKGKDVPTILANLEGMEKPPTVKKVSRRWMVLQKKFEVYGVAEKYPANSPGY
ncbi:DgyrCDS3922 [Dimorphilus gyrociliatus]|uniref:Small ribosomal subunit protein uS15m n=1 Tax=Dimorphilus gyrociliatus TaxID=2664684 RepID=A0A7I8VJZ2_9ANNE|nr:DgyrCDS3922 [Dimorphilus gyrociliatus]